MNNYTGKGMFIYTPGRQPDWEELYTDLINNCVLIDNLEKVTQGNRYIDCLKINIRSDSIEQY